jgi:hypothetical protein
MSCRKKKRYTTGSTAMESVRAVLALGYRIVKD